MSANPTFILLRSRRVTECDLVKLRSEHDAYEAMAKTAGRAPLRLAPSELRGCRGLSCEQHRKPCREGCDTTFKEMSVYQHDDESETRAKTELEWVIVWITIAVIGLVLAGTVAWVSYHYAEPILAALGRVLN